MGIIPFLPDSAGMEQHLPLALPDYALGNKRSPAIGGSETAIGRQYVPGQTLWARYADR
jgi:hypothetical protein